ncbi:TetR/AcrR family transcriptional regulator [Mycobacterium colombiense]
MALRAYDRLCHVTRRRSAASLPSYRPVPTRDRIEATRRKITAAAVHAFRVRGYSATTMSTVAAIAGVSPRTLYRYFGSKSELFMATIAEATSEFLYLLSIEMHSLSLRNAIIAAFEHAQIDINEESREMMRLASADEKIWRFFLGATARIQPKLAVTLRSATPGQQGEGSADEMFFYDIAASALTGAIATAYRRWAVTPGSELPELVAAAIDIVLPILPTHAPPRYPAGSSS